jgi:hypothetical protein
LGCPHLVSVTHNMLDFNKQITQPLGILHQLPITLGGKTIYIDYMVVHDPLEFTLVLGRDYVYTMKAIVYTLLRVIYLPHNGKIMTIDQISFVDPHLTSIHPPSLNNPSMQVVSPPPHINYVETCPMHSTLDEAFFELDPVVDIVIYSIWILEPNILTPIAALDIYSFQSIFLPSNEDLLESMIEVCPLTCIPSRALFSWKT